MIRCKDTHAADDRADHASGRPLCLPKLTPVTFVPRASTPLLDAMGRGITDLGSSLAAMPADTRPERIVMVIITDGEENASREFTRHQIACMIDERQRNDHWQFVFLSADLNAIADARSMGFLHCRSMMFDRTSHGTRSSWQGFSKHVREFRSGVCQEIRFDDEERNEQESDRRPQ